MKAATLTTGTIIQDTYQIVRCIGRGGMGEVYEARHARLAGRYAVKLLLKEISEQDEAFTRFRREAEVTSALRHPNIVQVVDFNRTLAGMPYLVMEYLDGHELTEVIRREAPMSPARVTDLIEQIASALEAAHGRGIVHRDLKPQNIFVVSVPGRSDLVKVMDFGISKVREATTKITREHSLIGTPQYMSPEQALGQIAQIDGRTDQFALAAITYEMFAGRPAFQGDSVQSILFQVVSRDPDALASLIPGFDREMAAVISRGLNKKRDERFPSVLEFSAALRDPKPKPVPRVKGADRAPSDKAPIRRKLPPGSPSPGVGRADRTDGRGRRAWPLLALTAAVAVLTVGGLVFRSRPGAKAADPPVGIDIVNTTATSPLRTPIVEPLPRPTAAAAATPPPGPPARPETVRLEVREPAPPGLQATVDGVLVDLPVELPRGPTLHQLRFDASGYQSYSIRVDATQSRQLLIPMRKISSVSARTLRATNAPVERTGPSTAGRAGESRVAATDAPSPPAAPVPAPARLPQPAHDSRKNKLITDF